MTIFSNFTKENKERTNRPAELSKTYFVQEIQYLALLFWEHHDY
jgi:hypothetical protein